VNVISVGRTVWTHALRWKYEAFWVFIGQFGIAAGVLLGVKLLTYVLDPVEFGRLTLANTIVLLIGVNLFGPLGHGFMRFWSISRERNCVKEFLESANFLAKVLAAIITALGLLLFVFSCFPGSSHWLPVISLAILVGVMTGFFGLRLAVFLAARKRKTVALVNSGTAFLKPLMAVLFVLVMIRSAQYALWGYLVAVFAVMCIVEALYRRLPGSGIQSRVPPTASVREIHGLSREILSFSWPFCAWGMVVWIHQSCDKWAVLAFHGADAVGEFSVTALLAFYPLVFASGFLINLFMPIAYERAGDLYSHQAVRSAHRCLLLMTGCYIVSAVLLIIIFGIFNKILVVLISNPKYIEFSYLLPGLAVSWALFYLGETLTGFGLIAKNPKIYILPKFVSGTIAAAGAFYLSSKIGVPGVVWGLGIAGLVYALWCTIVAFRCLQYRS